MSSSYFYSSQMERGFFFWAPNIKNRFTWLWWSFQSSYWLSLRGNLRYLQSCPCLQGHLIDTNGLLSWIRITVTLPSAVVALSKGEHWKLFGFMVWFEKKWERPFVVLYESFTSISCKIYSMSALDMIDRIALLWNVKGLFHSKLKETCLKNAKV